MNFYAISFAQVLEGEGVMVRIIFSLTMDEAMSVGLAKACALRKNLFCYREI